MGGARCSKGSVSLPWPLPRARVPRHWSSFAWPSASGRVAPTTPPQGGTPFKLSTPPHPTPPYPTPPHPRPAPHPATIHPPTTPFCLHPPLIAQVRARVGAIRDTLSRGLAALGAAAAGAPAWAARSLDELSPLALPLLTSPLVGDGPAAAAARALAGCLPGALGRHASDVAAALRVVAVTEQVCVCVGWVGGWVGGGVGGVWRGGAQDVGLNMVGEWVRCYYCLVCLAELCLFGQPWLAPGGKHAWHSQVRPCMHMHAPLHRCLSR